MSRIHIYQVDAERLIIANRSLLAAMLQDIVLGVSVAAAVDLGVYRHAWTIETRSVGETALEEAWLAAQDVLTGEARIAEKAPTARQSVRSDLYVIEDGDAFVAQGSWFAPYRGALPEGARGERQVRAARAVA